MHFSDLFTLLAFTLPLVIASPHEHKLRQTELDKRSRADVGLRKRISNARITFYDAGLGACGGTNQNSDFIVALNRPQFGKGSDCYKTITITANGKTHSATIVDECEGCPFGGLDMSPALFNYFASASAGIIYGEWEFGNGGGDDSSSPSTTHKSSHSSTQSSTTHSTYSTKKAAVTKTHSSTSTSTSSTQSISTTSINYSAGAASGLAIPTGAVTPGAVNNINSFNQVIIGLGGLVVAGADAN